MIRSRVVVLLTACLLMSCASVLNQKKPISIQQIEQLPIGASSEEVLRALGKPHEVRDSLIGKLWIYDSPSGDVQRASLSFDGDKKLQSKMVMPDEAEPESSMEFVLNSKFSKAKFLSVHFPQCGMDYVSGSAMYADIVTGVSVVYRKDRNETEAIGWSTPAQLRKNIADIESCKGRGKSK